ncbi:MAG: hypothetical protein Q9219_002651 [cf. Caloplaca sp. 3 TL-2023]
MASNTSQSYRPSLYAAAIITYILATAAVFLRFTARRLTHQRVWYDDWLVVVAWLAVTGFFIDSFFLTQNQNTGIDLGLGVHYEVLKTSYQKILRDTFLNLFVEEIFYSTGSAFMKLSLLAFYWRIFNVPSIRRPLKILVVAVIAWLLARYIAIILHCIPPSAYWDKSIKDATCGVDDRRFFMGTNTVNFILDLITLVLPMPYVHRLQVRRSQKLVVFGMFALGGFIVAVSIILLVVCYKLDNTSPDITWTISPVVLWAGTEINLGVVTACLPSLRPIFLLITKGRVKPDHPKASHHHFHNPSTFKSKAIATFGSRSCNAKPFAAAGTEDDRRPFSIIEEDKNVGGKGYNAIGSASGDSNIHLNALQPPLDRVMVREDIYVKYSDV